MPTPTRQMIRNRLSQPRSLARHRGAARILVVLALVAAVILCWGLWSRHHAAVQLQQATEAAAAQAVNVVHPQPSAGKNQILSLPGEVDALNAAAIHARTSGYLKRWLVDIGAQVKTGDLLAEIDAPELDQQLQQAKADLASAKVNAEIARTTATRWQGLAKIQAVSTQEAEQYKSKAEAAEATQAAQVANVQRLQELEDYTRVLAPFDGTITARSAEIGQLVTADNNSGTPLFQIADTHVLRIFVHVPQPYAAVMQPGLKADLIFPDHPGKKYPAELVRTSKAIDPATRTLLAELQVDNSSGELLPGSYTEVQFDVPGAVASAVVIPANTLLFRADGLRVATVVDGKVKLRNIKVGRDFGASVEIVDGISASDNVILNPSDSIADDMPVHIAQPATASEKD